jgi:hypothetical protein
MDSQLSSWKLSPPLPGDYWRNSKVDSNQLKSELCMLFRYGGKFFSQEIDSPRRIWEKYAGICSVICKDHTVGERGVLKEDFRCPRKQLLQSWTYPVPTYHSVWQAHVGHITYIFSFYHVGVLFPPRDGNLNLALGWELWAAALLVSLGRGLWGAYTETKGKRWRSQAKKS